MFVACNHQPLIQMGTMRGKNIFTSDQSLNKRNSGIHNDRPHQKGTKQKCVTALVGRDQRQDSKTIPQEGAADEAQPSGDDAPEAPALAASE